MKVVIPGYRLLNEHMTEHSTITVPAAFLTVGTVLANGLIVGNVTTKQSGARVIVWFGEWDGGKLLCDGASQIFADTDDVEVSTLA